MYKTTTQLGVTEAPDGDFNGDSFSDILWQNAVQRPGLGLGDERERP